MQRTANTRAGPKVSRSALATAAKATFGSGNALQLVSKQPGAIRGEPKPGQGEGQGIVDPYYNERGIVDPYYVPRQGIIDPAFATGSQGIIDPAFAPGSQGIIDPAFLSGIIDPAFMPQGIIDPAFATGSQGIIDPAFIVDPYYAPAGIIDPYYSPAGIIDPAFSPAALASGGPGAIAGDPQAIIDPAFGGGPKF
jgi:hypothetical protein